MILSITFSPPEISYGKWVLSPSIECHINSLDAENNSFTIIIHWAYGVIYYKHCWFDYKWGQRLLLLAFLDNFIYLFFFFSFFLLKNFFSYLFIYLFFTLQVFIYFFKKQEGCCYFDSQGHFATYLLFSLCVLGRMPRDFRSL